MGLKSVSGLLGSVWYVDRRQWAICNAPGIASRSAISVSVRSWRRPLYMAAASTFASLLDGSGTASVGVSLCGPR